MWKAKDCAVDSTITQDALQIRRLFDGLPAGVDAKLERLRRISHLFEDQFQGQMLNSEGDGPPPTHGNRP